MRNNKGISLIVLIVTIVVIVILAAVVILTITKNNPIESAKEARFKEDIRTFQYELSLAISKNMIAADKKITELDFEKIKEYISSFSEKYRDKIVIQDNELRYTNKINEKEKEWLESLKIVEKISLLPDGYTELEYIESTGTQYIQIYSINEKDTYELESNINFIIRNSRQAFGNVQARYIEINVNGYYGMGGSITSTAKATSGFDNIKLKIMSNKSQIILDNNVIAERSPLKLNGYDKLYLFGVEPRTYGNLNCKMRMKTTILKHNNNVVRNLIPCLNNNNEPCMYDTISKQTFYNQGTGEFLYKEKE